MSHHFSEIWDEFLAELKQDLVCRRIGRGMTRLEEHTQLLNNLNPESKNSALFAGYLAQWVDVGFQRPSLINSCQIKIILIVPRKESIKISMRRSLGPGGRTWRERCSRRRGRSVLFAPSQSARRPL